MRTVGENWRKECTCRTWS